MWCGMSALASKAEVQGTEQNFRKVPNADKAVGRSSLGGLPSRHPVAIHDD
jgi:hypothetical protein